MGDDFVVTISDLKRTGSCHKGARAWAQARRLDWQRFMAEGIPASELLATGDALAERIVRTLRTQREGSK